MNHLYLGIKGQVVAINKSTGQIVWQTKLKTSSITNVCIEQDKIFAHAGGHLFCLDAALGSILWTNKLSGLGYGSCLFAVPGQGQAVYATQQANAANASSGANAAT
ncbi:outer membrane protein assembly factor BamB family protein [Thalassotalea agarivorans]|uniref:PQQ-like domain-containing protein n=1 Tax=Thalassotalea agarivorans TaxID=349064 RepID=A0A1I0EX37_THASX|nr:PQQ-binding-like beta-propeller repeat protein [Thalassotalea agarivorans]SET50206.1 PQQ-like domain-containing protein [Thalassotalea agarivorans]